MDIVIRQGDQLVIEIDVVDVNLDPIDLEDAEVRYVINGIVDVTEEDDEVEVVEGDTPSVINRVRLTIDFIDWVPGRYRHECKVMRPEDDPEPQLGPATILPGTIFVIPSLIEENV